MKYTEYNVKGKIEQSEYLLMKDGKNEMIEYDASKIKDAECIVTNLYITRLFHKYLIQATKFLDTGTVVSRVFKYVNKYKMKPISTVAENDNLYVNSKYFFENDNSRLSITNGMGDIINVYSDKYMEPKYIYRGHLLIDDLYVKSKVYVANQLNSNADFHKVLFGVKKQNESRIVKEVYDFTLNNSKLTKIITSYIDRELFTLEFEFKDIPDIIYINFSTKKLNIVKAEDENKAVDVEIYDSENIYNICYDYLDLLKGINFSIITGFGQSVTAVFE